MKIYQLPKAFAEQWVKALRSGEYKQGTGRLYTPKEDSFCCIGVAEYILGTPLEDLSSKSMPCVLDAPRVPVGLRSLSSMFARELSDMNDNGVPFVKISDWIEENVEFI